MKVAALSVWVEAGPEGLGAPIEVWLILPASLFFRVFIGHDHTFSSRNSRRPGFKTTFQSTDSRIVQSEESLKISLDRQSGRVVRYGAQFTLASLGKCPFWKWLGRLFCT